ncbi:SNF2-related protein, partial [Ralstonia pseudosolanacearum]|uniref:SNF2-related protein n=1 Tax=Ralstonia pseudosolanacearum TaxID=1310165 RepID=UPI003D16A0B7
MTRYAPRVYQPAITNHILNHPRCFVAASMGTGKGPATLEALSMLLLLGEVKRVLVLGPKRVAVSTWPGEIEKFKASFGHMKIAVAVGDADTRRAAIGSDAVIVMANYDVLEWLVEYHGANWSFDCIVCDESTKLKSLRVSIQTSKSGKKFLTGQGGKRAKALARVALTRATRFICLSGTPAPNGLEDLWAQYFFLDSGRRLGTSFTAFSHRWFRARPGSDPQKQQIEPLPFADEQIRAAIKDITIALEARDYFDLPELIENDIKVEMPSAAMKLYKKMEQEMFVELEGKPIEAFSAAALSQKVLQIASGALYTDADGAWSLVHDAKIEALQSVVEEAAGMPVLCAYHFKSDLARIDRWNAGEIQMLVAHPQSAGHGLSLQHGSNILCFFSSNWSLEASAQMVERLGPTRQAQSGYNRPVYVHRLIAAGTLEEVVVKRLRTKASIQDALME